MLHFLLYLVSPTIQNVLKPIKDFYHFRTGEINKKTKQKWNDLNAFKKEKQECSVNKHSSKLAALLV